MLTSPYSLTTTAARAKACVLSRRLTSVVLPLPRNPVTSSTGTRGEGASYADKGVSLRARFLLSVGERSRAA